MQFRLETGGPELYAWDASLQPAAKPDDAMIDAAEMLACDMATDDGEFRVAVFVEEALPAEFVAKTVQRAEGLLRLPSGKLKLTAVLNEFLYGAPPSAVVDEISISPGDYAVEVSWLHWPRDEHRQKVRAMVGEQEITRLEVLNAQRVADRKKEKSRGCFSCLGIAGLLVVGTLLGVIGSFLAAGVASEVLGVTSAICGGIAILGLLCWIVWQSTRPNVFDSEHFKQSSKIARVSASLDEPFVVLSLRRLSEPAAPRSAAGVRTRFEWARRGS